MVKAKLQPFSKSKLYTFCVCVHKLKMFCASTHRRETVVFFLICNQVFTGKRKEQ